MKQYVKVKKLRALLPYFLLALAIICAYKLINEFHVFVGFIKRMGVIITPFFHGFLLAYILALPCGAIQRLLDKVKNSFVCKIKKTLSILITYLLFFLILLLVLNWMIPYVFRSVSLFIANFQTYYLSVQQLIDYINSLELFGVVISFDEVISMIRSFAIENMTAYFKALSGFSSAIFGAFLALFSSVYILSEKENFKKFLRRILKVFSSAMVYDSIIKYAQRLNKYFKQYIYTQTMDGCILGTLAAVELYILGSPYALTLGIMLGVVNYIPYFGSIIGSIIAVIVVALTQGIPSAIVTAIVLLVTQQIDGNVIQPKLMGGSFSLRPLLIIISITVGGAFAGILGMIAAIPIVAVLKDILDDVITYFERKKLQQETEGLHSEQ